MAHRSRVPKFGNWDGDNVPYTAYFENARKEKTSGVRINPNDPEQNPEAFNIGSSNISYAAPASVQKNIYNQEKSYSPKTVVSESSPSYNSASSIRKPKHQREKSWLGKYTSDGHNKLNNVDDFSSRSVSVPKFGEWDEKDPRSAEGFTVIFDKVKEEKQIAAAMFPSVPLQTPNNYQTSQKKETRKKCCCLF